MQRITIDTEELYQESIVRFFNNAMLPDFEVEGNVDNYIFGIAKNVYYCHLKSKKKVFTISEQDVLTIQDERPTTDYTHVLKNLLQHTTESCRKVLMYWARDYEMKEIATFMGYKSDMMARKKKHECLKKLCQYLDNNPSLKTKILADE